MVALAGGALGLVTAHYGIELAAQVFRRQAAAHGRNRAERVRCCCSRWGFRSSTGLLSGLLPALGMTSGDVNEALKQGLGRMDADGSSGFTRSALVTVEVALSLVLLIGAGLMVRSLWKLQSADPGFDERNVLTMA